jgi:hypothetical protein
VHLELLPDLSIGADYVGRRLGTALEDMSADEGITYFIANPGVSKPWTATSGRYAGTTYNPRTALGVNSTIGTTYAAGWPRPVRSYDAVSLTLTQAFSGRWLGLASYTWSSLRGNFGGAFRTEDGRLSPNATTEYDAVSTLPNRTGPMGLDRTHQVKVAGAYTLPVSSEVELAGGLSLVAVSGAPVNVMGGDLVGSFDSQFVLPRGSAGRLPWTVNLDLSAQVTWRLPGSLALRLSLDVFNVLDLSAVQWVDPVYTYDVVNPIPGATCSSHAAVSSPSPLAALARACPDLPYARTVDGLRVTPNLNFGRPAAGPVPTWQAPVRARLGVALQF